MSESINVQLDKITINYNKVVNMVKDRISELDKEKAKARMDFYSLPYEKQKESKQNYFDKLDSIGEKIRNLQKAISLLKSLMESIKHLAYLMSSVTRVRTSLEVLNEQLPDDENYREEKAELMGTFYDDVNSSVLDEVKRIRQAIMRIVNTLNVYGVNKLSPEGKGVVAYLDEIENDTVIMVDSNRVDGELRDDLAPDASVATQDKLRTLEEYDKRISDGKMSVIQKVDPHLLSKIGFRPSRIMVTGEKSRKALEMISSSEKQLEAINRALEMIFNNGDEQFKNTHDALENIRQQVLIRLSKEKKEFDGTDFDLILDAVGEESREQVIMVYANLYAGIELITRESPDNLDKIALLRSKLLSYMRDKNMTKDEVYAATLMGRKILAEKDLGEEETTARDELYAAIIERLNAEYYGEKIDSKVIDEEFDYYVKSAILPDEERALDTLIRHGYIEEGATLDNLTENQEQALIIQINAEERINKALKRYVKTIEVATGEKKLKR